MANNPNDPKPGPPNPPNDKGKKGPPDPKRRPEDEPLPDSVPFGAMSDGSSSDSIPFDELPVLPPSGGLSDPELYLSDPKHRGPRATPESAVFENLKSPSDSSLFENLKPDSDESLFDAVPPPSPKDSSTDGFELVPPAQPVSDMDLPAVGNLEPPAAVSPASGWIDTPPSKPSQPAQPLNVEEADLFEAPPLIESSDIFSTGAVPPSKPASGSDVLNATARGKGGPIAPEPPGRGSDVALSFDQPPGGSTIESGIRSGELPVADEVPTADPVASSGRLGRVSPGEDSPLYGATPDSTSDTSSILSELGSPGEVKIDDSSAIRLESPGMGRTSHPSSGTEFDLTIGEGEIPPELAEAAEAAESGLSRPHKRVSDPDLHTIPEMNIEEERVKPVDSRLRPDDPSSIFDSINDPVVFRRPGETERTEDDDAAVGFSDSDAEGGESGSGSSLFGRTGSRGRRPSRRPKSEGDFQLPAEPAEPVEPAGDSGVLDWKKPEPGDEGYDQSSNILLHGGRPATPSTEPIPDATSPTRAAPLVTPPASRDKPMRPAKGDAAKGDKSDSVEVDWVAGSSTEEPAVKAAPRETTPPPRKSKDRPAREPSEPRKAGMLPGALLGAGVALAACAGVYFSGIVPNKPKQTAQMPPLPVNPPGRGGEANHVAEAPPAAQIAGQPRLFAKIQELGKLNATVAAADDADLKKAREELKGVRDNAEAVKTQKGEWEAVQATIFLGVSHQIANEPDAARKVYEEGIKKFPKYASTFQGALDRLDATVTKPAGISLHNAPVRAEELLLAIVLLQPPATPEPEAGVYFWKAVKLASTGKYAEASEQIALAKAAHVKQAKVAPGGGLNPLSDPLHEIFPRSCDDLKAYWELRGAIYSNKAVAELVKKDGPAKALTELARRADGAIKLMADLETAKSSLVKAQDDYKNASTKLKKAESDFQDASTRLTKSVKELKDSKEVALKFEKEYKSADAARLTAEKNLASEVEARTAADTARKKGDDLIAGLAKELQTAKLLPEKYDAATILAAQKTATLRATGPTLTALLPTGTMAIGGGGLAAGQLTDIAERLTRAETASRVASEKFATETKRLQDAQAADVKKLTDGYAADTKKLMDSFTTSTTKLKEDHAAEVKKMADKFIADMKKLTDVYDARVKLLESSVAEEKKAAEALAAKFKVDLGAAMSPAQALDVWLPLLSDLRRPADADPALATATKVLSTAPADSEDAAKAHTVAGLAHFLKGDMAKAREQFLLAQANRSYRAGAVQGWARAADVGLQSINDPLAPLRRPIEGHKTDARAGARFLDAGMKAYKAGRYAEAAAALTQSARADPSNPLAWYFLGAAKWETVGADAARKEYEQGAEQERLSPIPARVIGNSLAPIQGAARDALTAARP